MDWESPDANSTMSIELPHKFTQGKAVKFTIPELANWSMVYLEWEM